MALKNRPLPPVITVEEVAEYLHVHKGHRLQVAPQRRIAGVQDRNRLAVQ